MHAVGAILLAAGNSSRLGQPKQLLMYEGESLLRRSAKAALAAACDPVVVVVGAESDRMRTELTGLPAAIAHNPAWESGMGSSLISGLRALLTLRPNVPAALILLCDQPHLTSDVLLRLRDAWHASGELAAACAFSNTMAPPCCIARELFPAIERMGNGHGAKHLLAGLGERLCRVDWPQAEVDIDTPADWQRLVNESGRSVCHAICPISAFRRGSLP